MIIALSIAFLFALAHFAKTANGDTAYINYFDFTEPTPSASLAFVTAQYVPTLSTASMVVSRGIDTHNQSLGKVMASQRGWTDQEWVCLDTLWATGESGWRATARNPVSGAYGIPQALPASKLDTYGDRHDPIVQIRWGLDYISQSYSTPCQAYQFWLKQKPNWY